MQLTDSVVTNEERKLGVISSEISLQGVSKVTRPVVPPHFLIAPARASAAWPMIVTLERIVLTGPCYFAHSLPCVCMFTVCSGAER